MVVLGTNASERCQEGMERHLSSVPQQESRSTSSSSYPDSVGLSTQEEDEDKELSYPIPASGKWTIRFPVLVVGGSEREFPKQAVADSFSMRGGVLRVVWEFEMIGP